MDAGTLGATLAAVTFIGALEVLGIIFAMWIDRGAAAPASSEAREVDVLTQASSWSGSSQLISDVRESTHARVFVPAATLAEPAASEASRVYLLRRATSLVERVEVDVGGD